MLLVKSKTCHALSNQNTVLFLYFCIVTVLSLSNKQVDVGSECSTKSDCGSDLLYCSKLGVCLCDESRANLVYEFRQHFSIREPKCEVKVCSLSSHSMKKNECDLELAECVPHPDNSAGSQGYCKCPSMLWGTRRPGVNLFDKCKVVNISSVGGRCYSNSHVCDFRKKLHCPDYGCQCHDDYVFDFEHSICIKKEAFLDLYGYSKLGAYGQYCDSFTDCKGDMLCRDKKCDCPYLCSEDNVKTEDLCYCHFDPTILLNILKGIAAFSILGLLLFCIYIFRRRQMLAEQERQPTNTTIVQNQAVALQNAPLVVYPVGPDGQVHTQYALLAYQSPAATANQQPQSVPLVRQQCTLGTSQPGNSSQTNNYDPAPPYSPPPPYNFLPQAPLDKPTMSSQ